jgi:hypothetical protein
MATESTEKHGLNTSSQLSIITTKNAKSTKDYKWSSWINHDTTTPDNHGTIKTARMWDVEAAKNHNTINPSSRSCDLIGGSTANPEIIYKRPWIPWLNHGMTLTHYDTVKCRLFLRYFF